MSVLKAFEGKPFTVLAFPCNEFLDQEPKSNTAIHEYATDTWNFTAPMFAKSNVNAKCNGEAGNCGPDSKKCCPQNDKVFDYLKSVLPGKVPWNFEKYLVDKNGTPVSKLGDGSPATDLEAAITKLLAA